MRPHDLTGHVFVASVQFGLLLRACHIRKLPERQSTSQRISFTLGIMSTAPAANQSIPIRVVRRSFRRQFGIGIERAVRPSAEQWVPCQ